MSCHTDSPSVCTRNQVSVYCFRMSDFPLFSPLQDPDSDAKEIAFHRQSLSELLHQRELLDRRIEARRDILAAALRARPDLVTPSDKGLRRRKSRDTGLGTMVADVLARANGASLTVDQVHDRIRGSAVDIASVPTKSQLRDALRYLEKTNRRISKAVDSEKKITYALRATQQ
jgi:hypothetical protein